MCVYRFVDAGKTKETKEEANVIANGPMNVSWF